MRGAHRVPSGGRHQSMAEIENKPAMVLSLVEWILMQEAIMEVIREIVDLDKLGNIIKIPEINNCSKAEILIFPIKETSLKNKETFVPEEFYGVSSIDNIEEAIQEIRDEWDRVWII